MAQSPRMAWAWDWLSRPTIADCRNRVRVQFGVDADFEGSSRASAVSLLIFSGRRSRFLFPDGAWTAATIYCHFFSGPSAVPRAAGVCHAQSSVSPRPQRLEQILRDLRRRQVLVNSLVIIVLARAGEESGDLISPAIFFCIPERKQRWAAGSAPMFRASESRGAAIASIMPAFFWRPLTNRPGARHHFSASLFRNAAFCAPLRSGSAGHRLMLWGSNARGSDGGALITGLSFGNLVSDHRGPFSTRFGVAARKIGSFCFRWRRSVPAVHSWMVGVISIPLESAGWSAGAAGLW